MPDIARSFQETILLVEDDEMVRELTCSLLVEMGYTVLQAENGAEAIHVVQSNKGPIHLLLTDMVMPTVSGQEFGERIKSLDPKTRVIYMSGYAGNAITDHLTDGIDFLRKPFGPDDLARKVREVLDRPPR